MQVVKVFNALAVFVAAYVEDHVVYKDMLNEEACPWDVDYLTKAFAYYMSLHDDDIATSCFDRAGYIIAFKSDTINGTMFLDTVCSDLREAIILCQHMTLVNH